MTALFWSNLLLIFGIFFAQSRIRIPLTEIVLHERWNPPPKGFTVAFVVAADMLCSLW
jgi:hypothetical protein